MGAPLRQAVFLDRDGTLNESSGYLGDPSRVRVLPSVVAALRLLREKGFRLIVVSNQSGIGRGFFEESDVRLVHERLNELLGGPERLIDEFRFCPHLPEDHCGCRKPGSKLLIDAATELGIDLRRSFMVGDRLGDLLAGRNAGCLASILVRTGDGLLTESAIRDGDADFVAENLKDAAHWIIRRALRA